MVAVINNNLEQGTSLISIHSSQLTDKPIGLDNRFGKLIFRVDPKAFCSKNFEGSEICVTLIRGKYYLCCNDGTKLGESVSFEVSV